MPFRKTMYKTCQKNNMWTFLYNKRKKSADNLQSLLMLNQLASASNGKLHVEV